MEKRIISKESLSDLFARDEIKASTMLRDALIEVKEKVGNITDPDIKIYNNMDDANYLFDISLTTIKNYASKNGYGVFNVDGDACIVKQFTVDDYKKIKNELNNMDENKGDKAMDNKSNLTAEQKLALNFVAKADAYKEQTSIAIRCAKTVQSRLDDVYKKYSMFPKQYIISYLLDMALTELEQDDEKN